MRVIIASPACWPTAWHLLPSRPRCRRQTTPSRLAAHHTRACSILRNDAMSHSALPGDITAGLAYEKAQACRPNHMPLMCVQEGTLWSIALVVGRPYTRVTHSGPGSLS